MKMPSDQPKAQKGGTATNKNGESKSEGSVTEGTALARSLTKVVEATELRKRSKPQDKG